MIKNATEAEFEIAFDFIEKLWTYNDYDEDTIRDVYLSVIDNEDDFMFFLVEGGEYIGFAHGTYFNTFWMSGQTCYLSSIITSNKYRRQGYARDVLPPLVEAGASRSRVLMNSA